MAIPEYSEISLKLKGNPTTGFSWYLENKDELLKSNIKPLNLNEYLSTEFIKQSNSGNILGQGGYFDFNFKFFPGAKQGSIAKFIYKRFNSQPGTEANKMEISFKIEPLTLLNSKIFEQNLEEGELEIKENELTSIKIKGNATTGYLWFLTNNDELKNSGINVINLGEKNTGKYIVEEPKEGEPMMCGAPGIFEFVFNIKKFPEGELPKLKFIHRRANEENGRSMTISLKRKCETQLNSLKIGMNGGKFDLEVENNNQFSIELKGNPTTGYSWFLENFEELKKSLIIKPLNLNEQKSSDYVADPCPEGMCGSGGKFHFKFEVKNAFGKDIPKLVFGYKRLWEKDVTDYKKAEINLKIKKSVIPSVNLKKEGGKVELKVENDKEFNIILEGNPSTGYSWTMDNVEEIKNSGVIEILNLDKYNSGEYVQDACEEGMCGVGGTYYFKFKVKEGNGKELPKLIFKYKRPWEKDVPAYGNAEITLKQ